ncbi:HAD family hydrolase [Oceanihabitans sediminis]|uniref:HAD family hydrolase n=1 Tax=Oceanihabitans sediminis TaxID=1812012 RepID=A0A368P4E0_9FLAO|nr:HAD family hydrolase [Oceanihabitans sediminis]MDX1278222.1 HAD family hydrolase [Oceanihabitans sediminis]MDX1773727.1 HAD family hydrolase [Oceanihabitans sediminis]RBP33172.1 putative hydrolase of the HAD superfamily [Oceanihabitans sediminis]RCU57323.1 HAD family hydrolase [Oceanihabitans sediminis]
MNKEYQHIKVIGFDADDTLWINETYFREAEEKFAKILGAFETTNKVDQELFKAQISNLPLYGYGIKGFILSMVEIALELSNYTLSNKAIEQILNIGKDMLNKPVELLDGVEETLEKLSNKYKLIVATKGDLLDQERKLEKSGLLDYFHHIEVLSDKKEENYSKLLNRLDIKPSEFLMIGNSMKSDILPLVNIKANAIHIPFHTTWAHEQVSERETNGKTYRTLKSLKELPDLLEKNGG